jgi:hypothetical protein
MKVKRLTLVAAIAVVALSASLAQAQGPKPATTATFLGKLKPAAHGRKASLTVQYSCTAGDTLWISAKQSKSGKRDKRLKAESSSEVAATWLDSHRNPITCDNAAHTASFTVDRVEKGTKGKLRKGQAWVQFCITLNEKKLTVSKSGWVAVS